MESHQRISRLWIQVGEIRSRSMIDLNTLDSDIKVQNNEFVLISSFPMKILLKQTYKRRYQLRSG